MNASVKIDSNSGPVVAEGYSGDIAEEYKVSLMRRSIRGSRMLWTADTLAHGRWEIAVSVRWRFTVVIK